MLILTCIFLISAIGFIICQYSEYNYVDFSDFIAGIGIAILITLFSSLVLVILSASIGSNLPDSSYIESSVTYELVDINSFYAIQESNSSCFNVKLKGEHIQNEELYNICPHESVETPTLKITSYKYKNPIAEFFLFNMKPDKNCLYIPKDTILLLE